MQIRKLRINHIEEPIGYSLNPLTLSWITESTGQSQKYARVIIALDSDLEEIVFDSGNEMLDSIAYHPDFQPEARTRYYWQVEVMADNGDSGKAVSYFETGKMDEAWVGEWIRAPFEDSPLITKDLSLDEVLSARLYVIGLGVYEVYCNGSKVGEEYLAPGYHSNDFWFQAYTYDLTDNLKKGQNTLGFMLGDGWYKGTFNCGATHKNIYGDEMILKAELHIITTDGKELVIPSDRSWQCHPSPIVKSEIYYGEDYDARLEVKGWSTPDRDQQGWLETVEPQTIPKQPIIDRLNPAIMKHEVFEPEIIYTKKDEILLDFGQNHTGWVEGDVDLPEGNILKLSYCELLQDDCFYNDNLRAAEAQYTYISNGEPAHIRPHFTFYGYRYVKVEGITDEKALEGFRAYAIYSALDVTGHIETSNSKVNQLISNALWGQKSNFLDVPTDCPQRDERLGWTGDTQAFSGTASYNMHTAAFYSKYMKDLMYEQDSLDGGVPFVVPWPKKGSLEILNKHSSCAWGDVAAILPWTLYQFYGDKSLLRKHYPSMKGWVDYIRRTDEADGGKRLWATGFHFADWLALDNYKDLDSPFGRTDDYYVASAYYAYSAELVAKAAKVLGCDEDAAEYKYLSDEVKAAMMAEYFSPNGRCVTDTQTAKVLALYMELVPDKMRPRVIKNLKQHLIDDDTYLKTGFVGTTYLCSTLSANGLNDMAYTLLLNEEMPSWLYEVNMGATTIWERWNSVLPDGSANPKGMNSMNHYTYGSVVEWMYRYMAGINPSPDAAGFKHITIEPMPDERIQSLNCSFDSPMGTYKSSWAIDKNEVVYEITVPFNASAALILEGSKSRELGPGEHVVRVKR